MSAHEGSALPLDPLLVRPGGPPSLETASTTTTTKTTTTTTSARVPPNGLLVPETGRGSTPAHYFPDVVKPPMRHDIPSNPLLNHPLLNFPTGEGRARTGEALRALATATHALGGGVPARLPNNAVTPPGNAAISGYYQPHLHPSVVKPTHFFQAPGTSTATTATTTSSMFHPGAEKPHLMTATSAAMAASMMMMATPGVISPHPSSSFIAPQTFSSTVTKSAASSSSLPGMMSQQYLMGNTLHGIGMSAMGGGGGGGIAFPTPTMTMTTMCPPPQVHAADLIKETQLSHFLQRTFVQQQNGPRCPLLFITQFKKRYYRHDNKSIQCFPTCQKFLDLREARLLGLDHAAAPFLPEFSGGNVNGSSSGGNFVTGNSNINAQRPNASSCTGRVEASYQMPVEYDPSKFHAVGRFLTATPTAGSIPGGAYPGLVKVGDFVEHLRFGTRGRLSQVTLSNSVPVIDPTRQTRLVHVAVEVNAGGSWTVEAELKRFRRNALEAPLKIPTFVYELIVLREVAPNKFQVVARDVSNLFEIASVRTLLRETLLFKERMSGGGPASTPASHEEEDEDNADAASEVASVMGGLEMNNNNDHHPENNLERKRKSTPAKKKIVKRKSEGMDASGGGGGDTASMEHDSTQLHPSQRRRSEAEHLEDQEQMQ